MTGCRASLRVAAARGEDVVVPRERRDARAVAVHRAHLLELVGVPQLHLVVQEVGLGLELGLGLEG